MRKLFYLSVILCAGLITSCKKEHTNNTIVSAIDLEKDSVYLYEKEDYLWFDAIPSYSTFNPRGYSGSSDLVTLSNELTAISQLKINPSTGKPYEYYPPAPGEAKYSFIDDGTTTTSLGGTNGDFGFEPIYIGLNDLRVKYVYPGSPADLAGIKRGYEILSINGNNDLTYDGGANVNFVVNAIYYSNTVAMVLEKPDGTTVNVTLNVTNYTVDPVLTYKVITLSTGQKVGYLAFNSFTDLSNAQPKLDQAFNYFISNGATDLVVDLRYNGGGAGQTAEYLDDLIVPAAKTGTLMYTTYFNSNLIGGNSPLIDKKFGFQTSDFQPANNKTNFQKALSLSVNKVFFIVTGETASSSELTINNLRPELNVQLVGDTTYGKPVGEIPIPLGATGKYILYSPQIYVQNSANQGDYYAGMAPGTAAFPGKLAADDVTKDFGDTTETLLNHALHFVRTGTYAVTGPKIQSLAAGKQLFSMQQLSAVSRKIDQHKFKAMVINKKARK